jgi:hypothetical protein
MDSINSRDSTIKRRSRYGVVMVFHAMLGDHLWDNQWDHQ